MDESAMVINFTSINNNDNVTNNYYLPTLNLLINKNRLAELKMNKPTISLGNQLGFNCKTQIPQVQLDTSYFNIKNWPKAPFNWIGVTQPAKKSYTVEDFVTTNLLFFTANGVNSALFEQADIIWDPCHQDHFSLRIIALQPIDFDFEIGVDSSWNYDTVCIILQEVGSNHFSLAQFNVPNGLFVPSDKWTGLVSDNIIDTYKIRFTRSPPDNTLLPPTSITTLTFKFSDQGTPPKVAVSSDKVTTCDIGLSYNCKISDVISDYTVNFPKDLTNCRPLHPVTFFACEVYSGLIVNPVDLVFKANVAVSSSDEEEVEQAAPSLKPIDNNEDLGEVELMSLKGYFTDLSSAANIYRAILILSSAFVVIFIFFLSCSIIKRIRRRKNRYKIHAQIQWKKV